MTLTRNTPAPPHRLRRASCWRTTQRKREEQETVAQILARCDFARAKSFALAMRGRLAA